jgi:hypothetical protein
LASLTVSAGCASQPVPVGQDHPAFLAGLIHGLTALFALLASPFLHYRIYAYPNDGLWYDLGFCMGFSITVTALLMTVLPLLGGLVTGRN